ncbi:hypothetical protein BX666DRAFT_2018519 [Dichotomocladium elegans]|nr:hypothetical protein BX666DRAFT_2018519 [Dichotomocladium elegans]
MRPLGFVIFNSQLEIKRRLNENMRLTIEENVQHVLALSSILLLKPGRTHEDLNEHITSIQCETLLMHILESNKIHGQMFPNETKAKLLEIVHHVIDNASMNINNDSEQCLRLAASCKVVGLMGAGSSAVRNMVETLPQYVIEDGPQETELITRYLQAALVPLTSVSDDEKTIMLRPDASINFVRGAALDRRLGCGEVKSQYQALNHRLVGLGLVRVAHFAKIASDKHKAKATFAFTVVGELLLRRTD